MVDFGEADVGGVVVVDSDAGAGVEVGVDVE